MKVATTQFSLQELAHPNDFWKRVRSLCVKAKSEGSVAILFPEYFSLSWIIARSSTGTFRDRILSSSDFIDDFLSSFEKLSSELQILIVAGTTPFIQDEEILNRCHIFFPSGQILFQDKVNMTRFEAEEWLVKGGAPDLKVFQWDGALCAVATCYDVEFPQYCAAAASAGVEVLFVPSCTDDVHGYWRVRHCAEARTIEGQCFAVMSSIVGGDSRFPEIEGHFGKGVILTPSDIGFPVQGLLAEGQENQEGVVTATLDLLRVRDIRKNGTVLNLRDSTRAMMTSTKF